ncbi:MAG: SMP-30/gluconolactonase/LRE family protein [Spirochaetes bacterium]|nr:SMP-30/gluconolactonase/LRE family protein [Spirochaetota bacterium]
MKKTSTVIFLLFIISPFVLSDNFVIKNKKEFNRIFSTDAGLITIAEGFQFTEGPVWVNEKGGYLIFSDVRANELKKYSKKDGIVTFRKPSHNANGNFLDPQGRLYTCEHSARRVTIRDQKGGIRVLVDHYRKKRFNSPNDIVVRSDGTVWFTDPTYGLEDKSQKELEGNYVFYFDPETKEIKIAAKDFDMPNGLCFSPDETKLYIADSGKPHHIRVFDVHAEGALKNGRVFCESDGNGPDGIRVDNDGRLYITAGDGIHIFTPEGSLIGKILTPVQPTNLCFGGSEKNILFITARSKLYCINLKVKGKY